MKEGETPIGPVPWTSCPGECVASPRTIQNSGGQGRSGSMGRVFCLCSMVKLVCWFAEAQGPGFCGELFLREMTAPADDANHDEPPACGCGLPVGLLSFCLTGLRPACEPVRMRNVAAAVPRHFDPPSHVRSASSFLVKSRHDGSESEISLLHLDMRTILHEPGNRAI